MAANVAGYDAAIFSYHCLESRQQSPVAAAGTLGAGAGRDVVTWNGIRESLTGNSAFNSGKYEVRRQLSFGGQISFSAKDIEHNFVFKAQLFNQSFYNRFDLF